MADKSTTYELIPPAGNKDVGKEVFRVLADIIQDKVRLGLHERWFRNYQLRRNLHWQNKTPAAVPLVSANLIYTHIQRTVNVLTDNEPTFNLVGMVEGSEEWKEAVMDLQRTAEHWWREQEQQDVLESSVLNGETYGVGIEKVLFNPDIEYGIGEVETVPVDPFSFGFYPPKMSLARDLQKCEAVCHFYPMSVRQLRRRYPDKAEQIKPDSELLKELMVDDRREIAAGSPGASGKSGALVSIASAIREIINYIAGSEGGQENDETLVCEMFTRDKSGNYTGDIRYILAVSGGVVLEDKDNPNVNKTLGDDKARETYLYDKFPYVMVNSVKDTSSAWGFSDLIQGEWLNKELDKTLSQFILEKDRSARKKLIIPRDSGVTSDMATNYVGVLEPSSTAAAQGIRWLETPPASVDYDKGIAMMKDFFFLVMGSFELDQAQVPGRDVIAYKAIAALLERAATMMRGKIRAYSRMIRERGRMYLSHVMNFYTEDRWITFRDEQGKEQTKKIRGSDLVMPARLSVVTGSTMPISRIQQREEAVALFEKGAIDQQELLEKLDYSNRNEVIKRMAAGPLGAVLQNLSQTGMPPELLQFVQQIGAAEPDKLQKAMEKGEIPSFPAFMQQLAEQYGGQEGMEGQVDPAQQAQFDELQAKVQESAAKAQKLMAEVGLIQEKIVTERAEQAVKLAGIEFDAETLKQQRAEIVMDMEKDAKDRQERSMDRVVDFHKDDMDRQERDVDRGIDEQRDTLDRREREQTAKTELGEREKDRKHELTVSKQSNRPGFNEKGGKSNNKGK